MSQDTETVCPVCKDAAEILLTQPASDDVIHKAINEKKLVLGGCIVTGHDPKWKCNVCYSRWGDCR